jgi:5-methylcytosine-specific restriction protein A
MPMMPAPPCHVPTCSHVQPCPDHGRRPPRPAWPARQLPRRVRGYDAAWVRLRDAFIRRPENVFCRECYKNGFVTPSTDVDHIQPFESLDDPRRLDPLNLQALCRDCHRRKSAGERRLA